jgi:hypothetical protein
LNASSPLSLLLSNPQTVASLTDAEARELLWTWNVWARPAQLPPPGDWRNWLVLAGRGFGKTRTGAEWVRSLVESGQARRVALVAPTAADARDVMVEGESGLLSVCPPWDRPHYEPSKRRLTWDSGAIATTYSADEPERLRGPQHDAAWCDEIGSWRRPAAWDMLLFGLRLGDDPRCCVTTTPKPTRLVRDLIASKTTSRTGGSTYENRANLAPQFLEQVIAAYEGTRLGEQEIHAQLSEIVDGAWFPSFGSARHVSPDAEYVPGLPVLLAIDCGTSFSTGAVFLQWRPDPTNPLRTLVNVFAEYLAEGLYSQANAEAINQLAGQRCAGRLDRIRLDPASRQRTGVGPVVFGEYERVFRRVAPWPLTPVTDGLDLIEVMLGGESRVPELTIHPRCTRLIKAFRSYQRAERAGEWLDEPKDPQHPHEDMMDALRGGLMDLFPSGRRPQPKLARVHAGKVF